MSGGSCGRRPRADDLLDRHRERQVDDLGARRRSSARGLCARRRLDRLADEARPCPSRGDRTPVTARSSVDLPAPFGPTSATRSPAAIDQVAASTTVRSPYATVTSVAARRGVASVTARTPTASRAAGTGRTARPAAPSRRRPGTSPASRATRSAADQQRRPDDRGDRQHALRGRPDEQPDEVRDDEPDEPDQPADRDGRRGRHRCQREQDRPLARDVDPEVARRGVAQQQAVERPRARDDQGDAPKISGAATSEPRSTTRRRGRRAGTRRSARSSTPDTYIAMVSTAASTEPTA